MSDINLDFTVSNNSIDFTVQPNDITITPTDIQLTFNPAITLFPGNSSPTELLYNNMNTVDGIPTVTYDGSNLALGNVANIKITGGTNGYVLQTDGTGNLDWTAQTGGGGNGSPGGSNTQIQYNDNGLFGGNTGFTFNEVTGNVNIPGNLIIAGNLVAPITANFANYAGNVTISAQPNITSLGTLSNLSVSGNANIATINTTNLNISNIANIVIGIENIAIIGAQTGTFNFDVLTSPIRYSNANAASNLILNIRGNSTTTFSSLIANGQSMTVSYVLTNGATAYGVTQLQIDGSNVTPKYAGSSLTIANSTISYTYTIVKNVGTYTVLGSVTRYQ